MPTALDNGRRSPRKLLATEGSWLRSAPSRRKPSVTGSLRPRHGPSSELGDRRDREENECRHRKDRAPEIAAEPTRPHGLEFGLLRLGCGDDPTLQRYEDSHRR